MSTNHPHRRRGFSLVELLVALALIVFLMAIISSAFAAASKAFRDLKAAGDLAEKLRGVTTMMRRDLMFPHFAANQRLSSNDVWGNQQFQQPPGTGYFNIRQGTQPELIPNPVGPGEVPTYINTTASISFTARMLATHPHYFFSTQLPNTTPAEQLLFTRVTVPEQDRRFMVPPNFHSEWAEITYWLTPQRTATLAQDVTVSEGGLPPQNLYTLRRRQRLLWTTGGAASIPTVPPNNPRNDATYPYAELSVPTPQAADRFPGPPAAPPNVAINQAAANLSQVTAPPYRFGMRIANPVTTGVRIEHRPSATAPGPQPESLRRTYAGELIGGAYPDNRIEDIIATDVLSFDVQVLLNDAPTFVHLNDPTVRPFSGWVAGAGNPYAFSNPAYRWDTGPWVFDTWRRQLVARYEYGPVGYQANWLRPGTYATIPLFKARNAQGQYIGPPIRIRAIQITLRVWDPKTYLSRQTSMVQDM